jgi:DNA-binding GntR family transcriptional regulator
VADDDPGIFMEIAGNVRQRIQLGEIKRGHPAPSITSLCQEFDATPETVAHAMRLLEAEGLVRSYPGRGYYVTAP